MNAAPRPWTCHEGFVRTVAGPWGIICECIAGFEDCPHDANANAALIVEAVNAHARLARMAEAGAELKDALFAYQHRNDSEPVEVIEAENRIDRAIAAYEQASEQETV